MRHSHRPLLLTAFAWLVCSGTNAQPGTLDPTFNGDGSNVFSSGLFHYADFDVTVTPAGDTYVSSSVQLDNDDVRIVVSHLFPNGTLDTGFGTDGYAYIGLGFETRGTAIDLAPDGGIVVAGYALIQNNNDGFLCKLQPTGALDPSFGTGGFVVVDAIFDLQLYGLLCEPDGRIAVVGFSGQTDGVFMRFEADGSVDQDFGISGTALCTAFEEVEYLAGLGAMPDGGYVGCGIVSADTGRAFIARVDADGAFVPTFGTGGVTEVELPGLTPLTVCGVAVADDGFYIGAGVFINPPSSADMAVAKFNPDGTPFTGYGDNGTVQIDLNNSESARGIALQNGRVVICGETGEGGFSGVPDFAVVRLTEAGDLDASFGESPGYTISEINSLGTWAFDLALLPDGRIVVAGGLGAAAGSLGFTVARYLTDGQFVSVEDVTGRPSGARLFPQPSVDGLFQLSTDERIAPGTPLSILDAQGGVVLAFRSPGIDAGGLATIDAHTLASGLYRLRIGADDRSWPLVIAR